MSNQRCGNAAGAVAVVFRIVPLSCVPPQNRSGTVGTVAIDVNCAICSPDAADTAVDAGFGIVPFRLTQLTALSGSLVPPVRPPRLRLYHTPPSEPLTILFE